MKSGLVILVAALAVASVAAYSEEREIDLEQHVMLISVDGLHASDLQQWTDTHPDCYLASLQQQGITYTEAYVDGLTDDFPGMLALATGGNVCAHNVYYDISYDRSLWAPGTKCSHGIPMGAVGTVVDFTDEIDRDETRLDGGGSNAIEAIDPSKLPVNSKCDPVYPHSYLYTNTVFEVVRECGGYTAWADKHPAYDLLNGPSGKGVCDLYTPEIDSYYPGTTESWVKNLTWIQEWDDLHVQAGIRWIRGLDHSGSDRKPVPTLFGMNFQTVSVTQKIPGGAYFSNGTFKPEMEGAMEYIDEAIGRLVDELHHQDLFHCTTIIITAKHGQAPINPAQRRAIPKADLLKALTDASIPVAHVTADDVALIWLADADQTEDAVKALQEKFGDLGIYELIYGGKLVREGLAVAIDNPRTPDVIVKVVQGVIYTTRNKGAEHGGLNPDDQHVALLVSGGGLPRASGCMGTLLHDKVTTKQVAPTILQLLDIEADKLEAVAEQHTKVLPWLFSKDACIDEEAYMKAAANTKST